MAEPTANTGTEPTNGAAPTTGNPTVATAPATPSGTATQPATPPANDGDTVTLKKEDYSNLVAARDRGNQAAATTEEQLQQMQYDFYKGKALEQAVKDYPDVPRDVLESAESPEAMETMAKAWQTNAEKIAEKVRTDIENVNTNTLSPADAAARLDKLKDSGDLAGALDIQMASSK